MSDDQDQAKPEKSDHSIESIRVANLLTGFYKLRKEYLLQKETYFNNEDTEFAVEYLVSQSAARVPIDRFSFTLPNSPTLLHVLASFQCATEALRNYQKEHIKLLVNSKDDEERTPLHAAIACIHTNINYITMLLEYGGDLNLADNQGVTVFQEAVLRGHNEHTIKVLLEHGADPNIQLAGNDSLCLALQVNTHVAQQIAQHPNYLGAKLLPNTVFLLACSLPQIDGGLDPASLVADLLAAGIKPNKNAVDADVLPDPLALILRRHLPGKVIQEVLDMDVDLTQMDSKGNNILHCLCRALVDQAVVQRVVDKLKSQERLQDFINAENQALETPLYTLTSAFIENGTPESYMLVAKILIAAGADLSHRCTRRKRTTLMLTCGAGLTVLSEEVARIFDENGAASRQVDVDDQSALHYLFSSLPFAGPYYNSTALANCAVQLIERGAPVDLLSKNGLTALDYLLRYSYRIPKHIRDTFATLDAEVSTRHTIRVSYKQEVENFFGILLPVLKKRDLLDCKDAEGYTLLHRFAQFGRVDFIKILYDAGADLFTQTNAGRNILVTGCSFTSPVTSIANSFSNLGQPTPKSKGFRRNPPPDFSLVTPLLASFGNYLPRKLRQSINKHRPSSKDVDSDLADCESDEDETKKSFAEPIQSALTDRNAVKVFIHRLLNAVSSRDFQALLTTQTKQSLGAQPELGALLSGDAAMSLDFNIPVTSFQNLFNSAAIQRELRLRLGNPQIQAELFGDKSAPQPDSQLLGLPTELLRTIVSFLSFYPGIPAPNPVKDLYHLSASCRAMKHLIHRDSPWFSTPPSTGRHLVVSMFDFGQDLTFSERGIVFPANEFQPRYDILALGILYPFAKFDRQSRQILPITQNAPMQQLIAASYSSSEKFVTNSRPIMVFDSKTKLISEWPEMEGRQHKDLLFTSGTVVHILGPSLSVFSIDTMSLTWEAKIFDYVGNAEPSVGPFGGTKNHHKEVHGTTVYIINNRGRFGVYDVLHHTSKEFTIPSAGSEPLFWRPPFWNQRHFFFKMYGVSSKKITNCVFYNKKGTFYCAARAPGTPSYFPSVDNWAFTPEGKTLIWSSDSVLVEIGDDSVTEVGLDGAPCKVLPGGTLAAAIGVLPDQRAIWKVISIDHLIATRTKPKPPERPKVVGPGLFGAVEPVGGFSAALPPDGQTSKGGALATSPSPTGGFGASALGSGEFGGQTSSGGFGSARPSGGFGGQSSSGGFGYSSPSSSGGFGAPQGGFGSSPSGGFGSPQSHSSTSGGFGSTSFGGRSSLFGATFSSSGSVSGGFGSSSSSGGFGASPSTTTWSGGSGSSQGGFGLSTSTSSGSSSSSGGFGGAAKSSFGSSSPSTSSGGFGSAPSPSGGFGSSSTSGGFGGAAKSGFGSSSPSTASGGFGSSSSGGFGSSSTPSTTTSGGFGSSSTSGGFGGAAKSGFWLSSPSTTTSGGFGSSSTSGGFGGAAKSGFGSSSPSTASGGFGSSSSGGFGSTSTPSTTTSGGFGSSFTSGGFGGAAKSDFGSSSPSTTTSGGFGSSSSGGFGSASTSSGGSGSSQGGFSVSSTSGGFGRSSASTSSGGFGSSSGGSDSTTGATKSSGFGSSGTSFISSSRGVGGQPATGSSGANSAGGFGAGTATGGFGGGATRWGSSGGGFGGGATEFGAGGGPTQPTGGGFGCGGFNRAGSHFSSGGGFSASRLPNIPESTKIREGIDIYFPVSRNSPILAGEDYYVVVCDGVVYLLDFGYHKLLLPDNSASSAATKDQD